MTFRVIRAVEHAPIQVVDLTQEHVFPTAQALAEAFSTEPLKGFFLSRSIPRRWFVIVLARILRARLTAGKPAYVAVAGGEVVGAVVIAPPRKYLVSGIHRRDAEVAEKFAQEGSFDSGSGIQSQNRFSLRSLRLRGKQIPPEIQGSGAGHWKIVLLGVRPGWRGRGVGSSLMDRAHALCDRDPDARGVYLSTHGRRNRSFYERLGYRVIGQIRLGRLELYRMVRPRA